MASDDKKKMRERFLLDRFLENQGITPTLIEQGESPDFLLSLHGRVVGIELTELFIQKERLRPNDLLLQEKETISTKILSKAHKIYSDADNPPIRSHILFSNLISPRDKRKVDQIAKLIADQIQSMSRQDSEGSNWTSREDEKAENPLSDWVSFISTWKVRDRRFARWSPNRVGLVATLTPARLQEEINKKACKISFYKTRADELWLLIVADRTQPSRMFSIMRDFPLDSISSPFEKTFYYCYGSLDPAFENQNVLEIRHK